MLFGINIGAIISVIIPLLLVFWVFHTGRVYDDFKKNGVRTVASITDIKQVSTSGTGAPKCLFTLSFTTRDNFPIITQVKQVISVVQLLPLERERKVDIYYKKDNPQQVWLIISDQKSE